MKLAIPLGRRGAQQPYNSRVFWSYFPDWALTIFLWGIFYLLDKINGYRRVFDVTDTSLAHPYAVHERIPVWLLAVTMGVVPAVIIVVTAALHKSFWDAHTGLLGLILSLGLGVTFTDIIKITVGRPRPDFFDRCQLPQDLTYNPVHGLTSWHACTRTDLLQEGFRSFPSGHSSFAWSGMWYLVLYLAAKLRVGNKRGYTFKSWILLIPVSGSSLVSVSRTMDYRHHATDVIAGAIVGILTAWWSYRQYYPPLAETKSWKPYSPRISKEVDLPMHNRDRQIEDNEAESTPLQGRTSATYPPQGGFNGGAFQQSHTTAHPHTNPINGSPVTQRYNEPAYPSPSFSGKSNATPLSTKPQQV